MTSLNPSQPVVEDDGTMSQAFREWSLLISRLEPIVGSGSPEGVVTASQYSLYIDNSTPLSPVQYRKMLPSIGGNRSNGWAAL